MNILSLVDTSGAIYRETIYHNSFLIENKTIKPVKCSNINCWGVTIDGLEHGTLCISCTNNRNIRSLSEYLQYFQSDKKWNSFCLRCQNMNYVNYGLLKHFSHHGIRKIIVLCGICQQHILYTTLKHSKFHIINSPVDFSSNPSQPSHSEPSHASHPSHSEPSHASHPLHLEPSHASHPSHSKPSQSTHILHLRIKLLERKIFRYTRTIDELEKSEFTLRRKNESLNEQISTLRHTISEIQLSEIKHQCPYCRKMSYFHRIYDTKMNTLECDICLLKFENNTYSSMCGHILCYNCLCSL